VKPEHPDSLPASARALLGRLAARSWAPDFYLAGSAALAGYLGHRAAGNLDLMGAVNRLTGSERKELLADLLDMDPEMRVETARDGYMFVRSAEDVALKFFHYPYPLADPQENLDGMAVASATDLGLMKLGALIGRARRRDFVDLYLLCQRLPLAELLRRSADKYGHVRDFPVQALKGLADRPLLPDEPMPPLSKPITWEEIEDWIDLQLETLAAEFLGVETSR